MPVRSFEAAGWVITFRLLPRPAEEHRRPEPPRSIGIGPMYSESPSDSRALRNTIKRKARHYADRSLAFALAVNVWLRFRSIDEIDVLQALIGTEVICYTFEGVDRMHGQATQDRDGVWLGPHGPTNQHLGAVLVVSNLLPWTIHTCKPTLYINPRSSPNSPPSLLDIDSVTWDPDTGHVIRTPGTSPATLFQFGPDWLDSDQTSTWRADRAMIRSGPAVPCPSRRPCSPRGLRVPPDSP
jgi:hypothetical protein